MAWRSFQSLRSLGGDWTPSLGTALSNDLRQLDTYLKQLNDRLGKLETNEPISNTGTTSSSAATPQSRVLTAGAGLTGGGDLSADRTFDVGAGTGITVGASMVGLANTAVTPGSYTYTSLTVDAQGRLTAASSGAAPALSTTTITAGDGLTGGGDLSANRTIDVGAGTGISVAANSVAVDQSFSPTWTGTHTFSLESVHNGGIDLGTSGQIDSNKVEGSGTTLMLLKPTTTQTTAPTTSFVHQLQDSAGNVHLATYQGGILELAGNVGGAVDGMVVVGATTAKNAGIFFAPLSFTGSGQSLCGLTAVAGGYFRAAQPASSGNTNHWVGGVFEGSSTNNNTTTIASLWGGWFRGNGIGSTGNTPRTVTDIGGIRVFGYQGSMTFGTVTNAYGVQIEDACATANGVPTNSYGLYVAKQTRGGMLNFSVKALGIIDCDEDVQARQVRADGDVSGVASNNTLTGATASPASDPGWTSSDTVAMTAPAGYIKFYVGTTAVAIPYWNV